MTDPAAVIADGALVMPPFGLLLFSRLAADAVRHLAGMDWATAWVSGTTCSAGSRWEARWHAVDLAIMLGDGCCSTGGVVWRDSASTG